MASVTLPLSDRRVQLVLQVTKAVDVRLAESLAAWRERRYGYQG